MLAMTIKGAFLGSLLLPVMVVTTSFHFSKQPMIRTSVAQMSIELTTSKTTEKVNKIRILTEFFKKYKSPLADHADTFVEVADKYNLDYRLLPAISCTESTCGKFLITATHNPFGWGIYGTKVTYFKSYEEAIDTVGKGISQNYAAYGLDTPEKMGPKYNPPSYRGWAGHTRFFMNQIDLIAYK
jgi:hypothetical protein